MEKLQLINSGEAAYVSSFLDKIQSLKVAMEFTGEYSGIRGWQHNNVKEQFEELLLKWTVHDITNENLYHKLLSMNNKEDRISCKEEDPNEEKKRDYIFPTQYSLLQWW